MMAPADVARWCEANGWLTGITPDEARCIAVLSSIDTGPHNLHPLTIGPNDDRIAVRRWGSTGVALIIDRTDLATYDGDALTDLVVNAHRHAVRVSIDSVIVGYLRVDDEDYRTWILNPRDNGPDPDWHLAIDGDLPDDLTLRPAVRLTAFARQPPTEGDRMWERHPTTADLTRRLA